MIYQRKVGRLLSTFMLLCAFVNANAQQAITPMPAGERMAGETKPDVPTLKSNKKQKPPIDLKIRLNDKLSTERFGFVGVEIVNNTDEWLHATKVSITLP